MIAVIADDFTGAAEIGGIGLRYGLRTEIETEVIPESRAELLIIATDTRSMEAGPAQAAVAEITRDLQSLRPEFIYKKVDSVLRGNVLAELIAQMETSQLDRALLVPANPSNGRKIVNGTYYIDNIRLHETGFADDPEYPCSSSDVLELLGTAPDYKSLVLKPGQEIPTGSIVVGEAESREHLQQWATQLEKTILPAGAADFFRQILEHNKLCEQELYSDYKITPGRRSLYVFGSAFPSSHKAVADAKEVGAAVFEMPDQLFSSPDSAEEFLESWADKIIEHYAGDSCAILAINKPLSENKLLPGKLRCATARVVKKVLEAVALNELFIEGGATAFSILNKAKILKLIPVQKLAPGVIRMKVEGQPHLHLTLKPGSYAWPKSAWPF